MALVGQHLTFDEEMMQSIEDRLRESAQITEAPEHQKNSVDPPPLLLAA